MKIAAAHALANAVNNLSADHVLPDPLNRNVAQKVAEAVREQAIKDNVQRPL